MVAMGSAEVYRGVPCPEYGEDLLQAEMKAARDREGIGAQGLRYEGPRACRQRERRHLQQRERERGHVSGDHQREATGPHDWTAGGLTQGQCRSPGPPVEQKSVESQQRDTRVPPFGPTSLPNDAPPRSRNGSPRGCGHTPLSSSWGTGAVSCHAVAAPGQDNSRDLLGILRLPQLPPVCLPLAHPLRSSIFVSREVATRPRAGCTGGGRIPKPYPVPTPVVCFHSSR